MMAYIQKTLITSLLLISIADESKGNIETCEMMINEEPPAAGMCCHAPREHPDVIIKEKNAIIPNCTNNEQERKVYRYIYGGEAHGVGTFTRETSKINYNNSRNGGIFACSTENYPFLFNETLCNSHKTFIISSVTDTHQNNDNVITYVKGEKVTLNCRVNLKFSYALLWIVEYTNQTTKCLSSMEIIQEINTYKCSQNKLCCPVEGMHQRYNKTHLLHYLDIGNITTSQSGEYRCIIFFFENGINSWKGMNKTRIQVTDGVTHPTGYVTYIVPGTIGGFAAVCAILCLTLLCIKCIRKQMKVNHSNSNAPPPEYECTPYAVSGGRENGLHTVYCKQEPMSVTDAEYAEVQLTPLAACNDAEYSEVWMGTQAEPHTVYSKVSM